MKNLFVLLFVIQLSYGQEYGSKIAGFELCMNRLNFSIDANTDSAIDRILSVTGTSRRFVLIPCDNADNASAATYKGIRYIFYNRDFMNSLKITENDWEVLFVMAHEIGHHLNAHSLDNLLYEQELGSKRLEPASLKEKRLMELEADEFAAFVLGKLGATLEETNSAIKLMSTGSSPTADDTYSTHPNLSKRLSAINIGYLKSINYENNAVSQTFKDEKSEKYFYSSLNKQLVNDNDGAYKDYLSFIEKDEDLDGYNKLIKDINSSKYTGRCTATTLKGSQCKRSAKQDLLFCWQHTDNNQSEIVKDRCKALTKSGSQCKRKVSDNKDFCWQHIKS